MTTNICALHSGSDVLRYSENSRGEYSMFAPLCTCVKEENFLDKMTCGAPMETCIALTGEVKYHVTRVMLPSEKDMEGHIIFDTFEEAEAHVLKEIEEDKKARRNIRYNVTRVST